MVALVCSAPRRASRAPLRMPTSAHSGLARALRFLAPALVLAAMGCATAPSRSGPPRADVEVLGEIPLPHDLVLDGAPVGGLSGLDFDPATGDYWAISDDRSERAPARVYRLRVDLVGGHLVPASFKVLETRFLAREGGEPFPRRGLDPEGIAFGGDRLFVSSEGEAGAGLAPFVAEASLAGRVVRELPLPARYLPTAPGVGVRENLAFENLAVVPGGRELLAATEGALASDGPASDFGVPSRARVLRWYLTRPAAAPAEYFYPLEAVSGAVPERPGFRVNGLADIRPLDANRFLALEREWVEGRGYSLRIYVVSLARATEISRLEGAALAAARPAEKRQLVDLARLDGVQLGNFEGMAFGPPLADGRRLLVLVADDNFHQYGEDGALLALAIEPLALTRR